MSSPWPKRCWTMTWLRRSRNTLRFSRAEWMNLWRGWRALLWAVWHLRRYPLPAVLGRVQAQRSFPSIGAGNRPGPRDVVRGVERASYLFPVPVLCLPQSIAIARLLVQQGHDCDFLVGAQLDEDSLDAHAWVEMGGVPINSAPDSAEQHPVWLHESLGAHPSSRVVG